jgi:tRNA A-37 threonylcarbamoyl transferase component Bud32
VPEGLQTGQVLGRYQIVRLIGQGGMGAVYEALHVVLKKRFAIKTLLPALAQMPDARARFLREGEASSRITHPNVVAVSDVGSEGDMPYMVMEFLEGQSLSDLLADRGHLEVREAVDILLPVMSAVSVGHDMGVVHRDLKPANVFLARGGWGALVPKVLDFGVSKLTGGDGAALTGTLAVLGTAAYMSPEQARGARQVDGKSDQYALGLVFYEMLTGQRAHPGENPLEVLHNIASGQVVPPRALRPDLPEALVAVLMRMLEKSAGERFPSLRAAGRALLPFAGDDLKAAMRDAFREAEGGGVEGPVRVRTTAVMPESGGAGAGGGARTPGSHGSAGGTQLLPDSQAGAGSTLGEAASQIGDPTEGILRGNGRRIAIGAGLLAALGVAVVALGLSSHETEVAESRRAVVQPSEPPPAKDDPAPAKPPKAVPPPETLPTVEPAVVAPPRGGAPALAPPPAPPVSPPPPPASSGSGHPRELALPGGSNSHRSHHPVPSPGTEHPAEHLSKEPAKNPPPVAHTPSSPPPVTKPPAKGNCDQKFYLDAQGDKHFKPECFLNSKK